jgi:hypothetical protein
LRGITAYAIGIERTGATAEAERRRMATIDVYIETAQGGKEKDGNVEWREKGWLEVKRLTRRFQAGYTRVSTSP